MADEPETVTPPFHTPQVTHQIASLYVGDLDPKVTEGTLYETFSKVGTVFSIRVCRDSTTGASLRYAYVNFSSMKDAERALDTLNFTPIAGKPIRIMWSRRDPSLRKSHQSNIFIKNLDKKIDNLELYDLFSNYGNILSCKVATDEKTGESRGYGFVHYETEESAKTAIQEMNGLLFNNKPVYVGKFLSKGERSSSTIKGDAKKVVTNIIVKNIDKSIDQETFVKVFTELEPNAPPKEVTSAVLKKGDIEGEPHKGFGFVNYKDPKDAELAIQLKHNTKLGEQVLFVGPHETAEERKKTKEALANQYTNIFINNIASSVTDASLATLFSEFPEGTKREVTSSVLRQSPRENTQYGFVNYKSHGDAVAAIAHFNNTVIDSKVLFVDRYMKKEQLKIETKDRNLYITNIEKSSDIEKIFNEFKQFGSIASCKIKEIPNSPYNAAYLCFVKQEDAKTALGAFNSNSNDFAVKLRAALGASVVVDLFLTGEQLKLVNRDRTIHVKNIAPTVTEDKLISLFREVGTISSCKIVHPKQSPYKTNFGYICFSKPDELTRALATMNNYLVEGYPLEVNMLQQKAERRAQLDVTHNVMYKHGPQRGAGFPDYAHGMYPQMYPAFQMAPGYPFVAAHRGPMKPRPYSYPRGGFSQNRGQKREFNQDAKPATVG